MPIEVITHEDFKVVEKDSIVLFPEATEIKVNADARVILNELYGNTGFEFSVCLNGYEANGGYVVDFVNLSTYVTNLNTDWVGSSPCSFVKLHNHPNGDSFPSMQDILAFRGDLAIVPKIRAFAIMYGVDKFVAYDRDSFKATYLRK